jgi:Tfp pilus assembly protein PilO
MTSGKRIIGALAIAIALFFAFTVVLVGFRRIGAFRTAITEREDILAKRIAILANIEAQYAKFTQQEGTDAGKMLAAFVPVRKDTAEIISAIDAIGVQSGVILDEFSIGEQQSGAQAGTYRTLSLQMSLSGSYSSLRLFLENVEAYVRLLNVTSLKVTTEQSGALRFEVTADAYFLK